MAVSEQNGTFLVSTTQINIIDDTNNGVHEGYLFFNALASGDSFEVVKEVQNPYRASLYRERAVIIDFINTTNGIDNAWHLKPVYSPHYRIKIRKLTGNDRDVDFYKVRYF